jgi:hypothetical protein
MSTHHKSRPEFEPTDQMAVLVESLIDGDLSAEQQASLEDIIRRDPAARRWFLDEMQFHAALKWDCIERVEQPADSEPNAAQFTAIPLLGEATPSPINISFFSGWPAAYLIATVLFAIGLTTAALVHVSQPNQQWQLASPSPDPQSSPPGPASIVARITAMVDCQWEGSAFRGQGSGAANQKSEIRNHKSLIHLGDRLALRSGLLEITYDTGAKVILQGPVTYEVESPAGGYLAIGKLTAKLEKRSEVRGQRSEPANQKSEIRNQKSFAVRTPTATVTDLGTEFGVDVDKDGGTTSHVFRGVVKVQALGVEDQSGAVVLRESESVRTQKARDGRGEHVVLRRVAVDSRTFTRKIAPTVGSIDLSDIVAGGNGLSRRRPRSIAPSGGLQDTVLTPKNLADNQVQRFAMNAKSIDRVFSTCENRGTIQLDSAGHTFDGFPKCAANVAGSVTATGPMGSAKHRGLIGLQGNAGITFDLQTLRDRYPGVRPARLRASVFCGAPAATTTLFCDDFQSDAAGTMPRDSGRSLQPSIGAGDVGGPWLCRLVDPSSLQVWNNADPGRPNNDPGGNRYVSVRRDDWQREGVLWATGWPVGATTNKQVELTFSFWKDSAQPAFLAVAGFADQLDNGRTFSIYFHSNGTVSYYRDNQLFDAGITYQTNSWQNAVLKADLATQTFSLTVGDSTAKGLRWSDGANQVNDIYIGNGGESKGHFFIDQVKFTCVAGLAESEHKGFAGKGQGDLWVFVDGRLMVNRMRLRPQDGAIPTDVAIGPDSRYLTIVATGDIAATERSWIILGDPVLETKPASETEP